MDVIMYTLTSKSSCYTYICNAQETWPNYKPDTLTAMSRFHSKSWEKCRM